MTETLQAAERLTCESLVIDVHYDLGMDLCDRYDRGESRIWPEYESSFSAGGLKGLVSSLFLHSYFLPEMALRKALDQIACLLKEQEAFKERVSICRSASELEEAAAEGRTGILLSFEGVEPLGNDLSLLRVFYELGVRGVGLAWSRRNEAADGCHFAPKREGRKGGLTPFGVQVVEEAERLGMWIDVSHLNDEGFWDVAAIARGPLIASHSNCRALVPGMMRNLTDDQIVAIAKTGGVIGMNSCSAFVKPDHDRRRLGPEDLADHVDHIAKLVGSQHVCLGFDFCNGFKDYLTMGCSVPTYDVVAGHREIPAFAAVLLQRGYSEDEVRGILGGNAMRVFKKVLA